MKHFYQYLKDNNQNQSKSSNDLWKLIYNKLNNIKSQNLIAEAIDTDMPTARPHPEEVRIIEAGLLRNAYFSLGSRPVTYGLAWHGIDYSNPIRFPFRQSNTHLSTFIWFNLCNMGDQVTILNRILEIIHIVDINSP